MSEEHKSIHSHDHETTHTHEHTQDHLYTHSQTPASEIKPVDETIALLSYMCDHNVHHAEELSELSESLSGDVAFRLEKAIGVFNAANESLANVLEQVKNEAEEQAEGEREKEEGNSEKHEHSHDHKHEQTHEHGHFHDPAEKRREIARLSRIIGHLEFVRRMLADDEDCSDVLMQITAAKSALNGLANSIIGEHMNHCIIHAIEESDTKSVEDFQKAIQRYLK